MELPPIGSEPITCGNLKIYTNGSGEVFVRLVTKTDETVTIRISSDRDRIGITSQNSIMTFGSHNGLPMVFAGGV